MKLKSFLRVWQLAMELVEIIYRLTQNFPKHEIYGLTSQIQRAAVSNSRTCSLVGQATVCPAKRTTRKGENIEASISPLHN
jgi:hypothetical protein